MDKNSGSTGEMRGRGSGMDLLRVLAAGYLIYLGISMITDHLNGRSDMAPWLAWACGVLFVLAGAAFAWFSWKRYRAEQAEKPEEATVPEAAAAAETTETPSEEKGESS